MRRNIYQHVKYITLLTLYHYANNMSTDFLSYFVKKRKIFCNLLYYNTNKASIFKCYRIL